MRGSRSRKSSFVCARTILSSPSSGACCVIAKITLTRSVPGRYSESVMNSRSLRRPVLLHVGEVRLEHLLGHRPREAVVLGARELDRAVDQHEPRDVAAAPRHVLQRDRAAHRPADERDVLEAELGRARTRGRRPSRRSRSGCSACPTRPCRGGRRRRRGGCARAAGSRARTGRCDSFQPWTSTIVRSPEPRSRDAQAHAVRGGDECSSRRTVEAQWVCERRSAS